MFIKYVFHIYDVLRRTIKLLEGVIIIKLYGHCSMLSSYCLSSQILWLSTLISVLNVYFVGWNPWKGLLLRFHVGNYKVGYLAFSIIRCLSYKSILCGLRNWCEGYCSIVGHPWLICHTGAHEFNLCDAANHERSYYFILFEGLIELNLICNDFFLFCRDLLPSNPHLRLVS